MYQDVQSSHSITIIVTFFFIISSLQVLLSAVDDLLNTLLESEDTNLLGVYIGSVMPSSSEWEKMRQSLPMQVYLRLDSAYLILKFGLHASLNIFILFWGRKWKQNQSLFFFWGEKR